MDTHVNNIQIILTNKRDFQHEITLTSLIQDRPNIFQLKDGINIKHELQKFICVTKKIYLNVDTNFLHVRTATEISQQKVRNNHTQNNKVKI